MSIYYFPFDSHKNEYKHQINSKTKKAMLKIFNLNTLMLKLLSAIFKVTKF